MTPVITPGTLFAAKGSEMRKPLDRQIAEKIHISRFQGEILMNRKSELGGAVVERERFKYRRWGPN